jgi:release factor glutamine methyltransferase
LSQNESAFVADLGVGSGAVAIALASERPSWKIIGADISEETLNIAMNNVRKHNIKNIILMASDWFEKFTDQKFDAIVSNPPYVAEHDPHLAQLSFEPLGALISGKDGLNAIRQIILNSRRYLKDQGWLLLEHGYDQAAQVRALLHDAGYQEVASAKDINNIERITYGQMKDGKNASSVSK